jgi:hypothetical protein
MKWASVVYVPNLTKEHLERPFYPLSPSDVDFDILWMGYADYVMEVYSEYHFSEKLCEPDEEFFQEICYSQLHGVVEPEVLVDIYETLTREHHPYLLTVMNEIAEGHGYLKSTQGQWYRLTKTKAIPMLFFETSTLFDMVNTEQSYTPLID